MHKDNRYNKLVLRGKKRVYIGVSLDTTKYLKIYALDLGYIMLSNYLFVDKLVMGGIINLRLRNYISGP